MSIAISPGTFDPITFGHLNVIERASKSFDKLIVAVLVNPSKTPMFTMDERVELIREAVKELPNVEVIGYPGLLTDYMRENGIRTIAKGYRNHKDFEEEVEQALINKNLYEEAETLLMIPDAKYEIVRSSTVKSIARYGRSISNLVPKHVEEALLERISVEQDKGKG